MVLKKVDKRQGYRGALIHLSSEEDIQQFLKTEQEKIIKQRQQFHILRLVPLKEDVQTERFKKLFIEDLRKGKSTQAVVQDVQKEIKVLLPFHFKGLISKERMDWALKSSDHRFPSDLNPHQILKKGDVVLVRMAEKDLKEGSKEFSKEGKNSSLSLSLDQEPLVEGALVAFDQKTGDILALVGGYDFGRSQFNRVYQAHRQTGSAFKPIIYIAALDKGYTPASVIADAPVVYDEEEAEDKDLLVKEETDSQDEEEHKKWKPGNYGRNFSGYILFRNALIQSINIPTVKIIEKIGIKWVLDYAHRLGIFSPLNPDYTLALGSSSVTLYEMTKVFFYSREIGEKY